MSAKKNDWMLYAFILKFYDQEISLHDLHEKVALFSGRDSSTRRIAAVISGHQKHGFEKTLIRVENKMIPMYSFNRNLPAIPPRTQKNWSEILLRSNRGE